MADDFKTFFKQATRYTPFPYQRRLADPTSDLPELLQVPTGTGKTAAAVLSWLWRRKKRPAETPRKLVYCLPMRVLVEQTRACAVLWLHRLGRLAGLAELDENDRVVRYEPTWGEPGKVAVAALMGGETGDRWREHPESELLLVGTQDMLVSRALNRGYAAWPQDWPVEFGLLNIDSLWVMDEVQLMGPARTTSVQLQVFAEEHSARRRDEQLPPRRTLWMSATMGAPAGSFDPPQWMRTPERGTRELRAPVAGVREDGPKDENDLTHEEFAKRWRAPKQLELHVVRLETAASPGQRSPARRAKIKDEPSTAWTIDSDVLVQRIVQEATSGPHRTVLVFVNRVDRARALFDRLSAVFTNNDCLLLLHARFRPRDRHATERRLNETAPPGSRIVVSTQVLEAGVDLNAHALFTEVCPWPSLVQRLGRLNRRGAQVSPAPAVVFDVQLPPRRDSESDADYRDLARRQSSLPYEAAELDITRTRLDSVSKQGGSVSPEALSKLGASIELAGPVLRRFDLDDLFDTDPDLAGGHTDVAPFVRALDRDVDAYVLWRRLAIPPDDQPPVHPDELCGVPFYEVREAFAGQNVWILSLATSRRHGGAWRRTRADEVRAGDTVMVDLSAGCYTEASGWLGKGQRARTPRSWIERWERANGAFRAWARGGPSPDRPSFAEEDLIDTHIDARRACGEDPRSYTKSWMELDHHLRKAEEQARDIVEALTLPSGVSLAACTAARWHDVGKALEREMDGKTLRPFQNMLLKSGRPEDGEPREGVLYAKSNRRGGPPAGFRHEVASALSYLARADADDLVAYLIIAHHGKVRLLPTPWDDDNPVDANGVRPGDAVPSAAVPGVVNGEPVRLDPMTFLASRSHSSWQGRIARLLEQLGPFGLAYLEALVRVADWRAS